jgi:hypothetical protein
MAMNDILSNLLQLVLIVVVLLFFGSITMVLWNWIFPWFTDTAPQITLWQGCLIYLGINCVAVLFGWND